MPLKFLVLGPLEVQVDGESRALGGPRQRAVLAALLLRANEVVTFEYLADAVWERPPARPESNLRTYVSGLRGQLGAQADRLVTRPGGYLLRVTADELDLTAFDQAAGAARAADEPESAAALFDRALRLWRGRPIEGLVAGPALAAEAAGLEERYHGLLSDYVAVRFRLGQHADVVPELRKLTAVHPLREKLWSDLLTALHASGRRADALAAYREVRELLDRELGVQPGAQLAQAHARVLADPEADVPRLPVPVARLVPERDGDPAAERPVGERNPAAEPVPPAAGGPPVAPNQLPAAPSSFTGRASQLAALDRAVPAPDGSPRAGTTAVICGTGGIGKTWLALTWAHRNLHHFPDGQLSADLRGFGLDEPRQAFEVLADFLAALGVDRAHQPQDLDARAALFRTRTTGKRILVLLDNVVAADQVVPLLPGGTGSTVLVTSRNRLPALLTRHGARAVDVDVLTDTEAGTVVEEALGGTTVPQVTELVALCGGFPLAVGLVAARIRTHPHLLDDIVADLRELGLDALDSDDPATSLPTVLSWSLRHLTDRQRTAFALLGIAPGPDIDLSAAAGLVGLPARDAHAVLSRLAEASLLTPASGRRYSMHDLIRAYAVRTAHDELPEAVRRTALERAVDFYLHTAYTADRSLNPHRSPISLDPPGPGASPRTLSDPEPARAWLDDHHPHLIASQRLAVAEHRPHAVWSLAWTLSTYHVWRGHRHTELALWQVVGDVIEHLPDPASRENVHRRLGLAHAEVGQHRQAIDHLDQALVLAGENPDWTQQAHSHKALSMVWARQGDNRRAAEHAFRALELYRAVGDPVNQADVLNRAGWYSALLGEYETGRQHCRAALVLNRRHDNPDGEADALDSLGWIDHRTGHHQRAIDRYQQALTLFRALGNITQVASTLENLGHPYAALGRHEQAAAAWQEALELFRAQGRHDEAERTQRQLLATRDVSSAL